MNDRSPEFRLDAFKQDIDNLCLTLDRFEMLYNLRKQNIKIKDSMEGKFQQAEIDIPVFVLHQFLGRFCAVLAELQNKAEGVIIDEETQMKPKCKIHGTEMPAMQIGEKIYCLQCIGERIFHEC